MSRPANVQAEAVAKILARCPEVQRTVCGYCRGSGRDCFDPGTCTRCRGRGSIETLLRGRRRDAWIDAEIRKCGLNPAEARAAYARQQIGVH